MLRLASITALCLVPFGASAADLGSPTIPGGAFSWTGFYLGATVGGVSHRSSLLNAGGSSGGALGIGERISTSGEGVIGGLTAGYNYQWDRFVIGLEGDISLTSASASYTDPDLAVGNKLESLGTVRGRFGYAFDRSLVYATGGFAFGNIHHSLDDGNNAIYSKSKTLGGWTVGGGAEFALTDKISLKAEALYYDLGSTSTMSDDTNYGPYRDKVTGVVARAGVNYRF